MFMKKIIITIMSICISVFFFITARAYVLTGPHILELSTRKIGTPKRLSVKQKLIFYRQNNNNHLDADQVEFNETLSYMFPHNFRSDVVSETTQKIHVVSSDQSVTVIGGKIVPLSESGFTCYKDLLLYRDRDLLQQRLIDIGVDVAISSLGRFNGKIAYVIGAKYPDESVSQVWLDKDTFRPFRWLIKNKENGNNKEAMEFRYLNWQKVKRSWYPMLIEFYQEGDLSRRIEVNSIQVNPVFNEALFDIAFIKSIYPSVVADTSDQHDSDEVNEVQKTIEDFTKIFE